MTNIQLVKREGEQRVDSRAIAGQLNIEHRATLALLRKYKEDFQELGHLAFEMHVANRRQGGGSPTEYALLNEDQCYLLLTYSRNTSKVRSLKLALVKAFRDARKQASIDSALNLVLLQEPATWEKRFGDDYYAALAKVTGTRYNGHKSGTPYIFGKITDKWIYAVLLPREIHKELKARRGESEKMHQWLTDGGKERLDQHIALVTLMAETSCDLKDFEARCMSRFGVPGQLSLIYPVAA